MMWFTKEIRPRLRDDSDFLSVDVLGCFFNGRMMVLNYNSLKGWVDAEEGIPIFSDRLIAWSLLPDPPNDLIKT